MRFLDDISVPFDKCDLKVLFREEVLGSCCFEDFGTSLGQSLQCVGWFPFLSLDYHCLSEPLDVSLEPPESAEILHVILKLHLHV